MRWGTGFLGGDGWGVGRVAGWGGFYKRLGWLLGGSGGLKEHMVIVTQEEVQTHPCFELDAERGGLSRAACFHTNGQVGEGAGAGFNVNVGWKSKGMADQDYLVCAGLVAAG